MSTQPFILCADDFALSTSSSQGILSLLANARLSAVSCVVNTELWSKLGPLLHPFRGQVDLGLHFNLTEGAWLSQPEYHHLGLKQLITKAYTRSLTVASITVELLTQIEAFIKVMGQPPDFIDGHQHIQQFPIIRQAIMEWFRHEPHSQRLYLRCSYLKHLKGNNVLKRWIINQLGAKTFKKQLARTSIRHNHRFSGVYDFSPQADYGKLFKLFLSEMDGPGLIMCHPAEGTDAADPHTLARNREGAYLMSDAFLMDCKTAGLHLSRGDFLK